jgi:hypothetical protein
MLLVTWVEEVEKVLSRRLLEVDNDPLPKTVCEELG